MLFHTAEFALFMALAWVVYWALRTRERPRTVALTLASWGFYAAWDWRFLALLLVSTIVDFVCARQIAAGGERRGRWLALSVIVNLGILATFKYLDFFASSTVAALQALGMQADWVSLHLVLPVGISFYTFQTLGYTIDVHRGRSPACEEFWPFAAYVAFFPQLVAGPIERVSTLLPQLRRTPEFAIADQLEGGRRFLIGLWKKLVIADNLGAYVDWVFATPVEQVAGYQVVLGVLAFAGQIWADFSGYTDMALGVARTLGIRLSENFDAPYLARGPRDFWRRWHITLSTWLRDYVYVPLGGNRRGPIRTQINLGLTMLLGGLWHGAAWTFVIWGAFHGLWLAIDRTLLGQGAWRIVPTFALVCVGWLIFRAPSLEVAVGFLAALAELAEPLDPAVWIDAAYVLHFGWPVVVLHLVRRVDDDVRPQVGWVIALYAALALLSEPIARHDAPFIYFQF